MVRNRFRLESGLLLLSFALSVEAARADSDGYYCVGPDYVAYETRMGDGGMHALHIVRLSGPDGLVRLEPVPLDDFQVHGMRCDSTRVDLVGWKTQTTVDFSDPAGASITREAATPEERRSAVTPNLGHWGKPGVVDLDVAGSPGEFQLVVTRTERSIEGGLEHYTFSLLVRRSPGSPFAELLQRMVLFEGIRFEPIH